MRISWLKDKQRIETKHQSGPVYSVGDHHSIHSEPTLADSSRYEIADKPTDHGLISCLEIGKSERKDSGLFTCFAYNQYGQDDTNIQLIIQERPDAPTDMQVVEINSRSIKLSWSTPFNGNLPITSYLVQYSDEQTAFQQGESKAHSNAAIHNITIKTNECVATLTQLRPARVYYARIIAENRLGTSEASSVIDVSTDEDTPSAPPTKLKSVVLSSKQVKVNWKSPDESSLNGQLKGFYIGFRLMNGQASKEAYVYKTVEADGKSMEQATTCILGNLRKNSKYGIIVQAYNNKGKINNQINCLFMWY